MADLTLKEKIGDRIYTIRGQRVMLDRDLAELYGVKTKYLNRQVRRNIERFPEEFMFRLTKEEKQEVVTNWHHLEGLKYSYRFPYAFTEHGVAMLASVLNSERAVQISICIVSAFIKLRRLFSTHRELALKIDLLEEKFGKRLDKHDREIAVVFEAIKKMIAVENKPKRRIGFLADR